MAGYSLLEGIDSPRDLDGLDYDQLRDLSEEIRSFLVEKVTRTGGHLASNLGVVELTLALHRVFQCPFDKIVFDVGHQSYVHKLLTGRRDAFDTLRQPGGLSGFPKREESEYDCFGAGHSSTSLSAALGIAEAERLKGTGAYTVAVIGDGAFTGGMIHEALNNCPDRQGLRLVIVINENEMSISKNTGRFAETIARTRSTPRYFRTKEVTKRVLSRIPLIGKPLTRGIIRVKKSLKDALYGSNYFEDLGLFYLGPVDGNNVEKVEAVLKEAKKCGQNAVVHIKTVKGKGFAPAEKTPDAYHSVKPEGKTDGYTFSDCMGEALCRLGEDDSRVCAITAAMAGGTGMEAFRDRFADRFFDVGIAEEHALTFAAGLASDGMIPVTAIYSTFLQRGYDNIVHDIALQHLPAILCVDRAGLNSGDGATHHGIFDVSFLSGIPGINLFAPATYTALETALRIAAGRDGPSAIRYPSGSEDAAVKKEFYTESPEKFFGVRFSRLEAGVQTVIVSHGRSAGAALRAADLLAGRGLRVGLCLCEIIKPYEVPAMLLASGLPESVRRLIFVEEEVRAGGFGMNLADRLACDYPDRPFDTLIIASDDSFVIPAAGQTAAEAAGVDAASVAEKTAAFCGR